MTIREPARDIPVIGEFDIAVIGGSCTGVFAAVRAARLGTPCPSRACAPREAHTVKNRGLLPASM